MDPSPATIVLVRGEFTGGYEQSNFGSASRASSLLEVARALAANDHWREAPDARLIVRTAPRPLLAAVGHFDAATLVRLGWLQEQLQMPLPRNLSYAEAEQECEVLGEKLVDHFGLGEMARFQFVAVPRGGLIVLGMLAYVLGLRRSQVGSPGASDNPLIVVDDCSISGLRFKQTLERLENSHVAFAHLYSHPDLRASIESREARVIACIAASDLIDHSPRPPGVAGIPDNSLEFGASDVQRYWVGHPDPIAFPWTEPDQGRFNPVTQQMEKAWSLTPANLCLRNRYASGSPTIRVHVQESGKGPLAADPDVLTADLDGGFLIANARTGNTHRLNGVAGDMWAAIVREGNLEDAIASLMRAYQVDETRLRTDLDAFVSQSIARGLLVAHRPCV